MRNGVAHVREIARMSLKLMETVKVMLVIDYNYSLNGDDAGNGDGVSVSVFVFVFLSVFVSFFVVRICI